MWVRLLQRLYGVLAVPVLALIIFGLVCPLILLAPTLPIRRNLGRWGVRLGLLSIGIPLRVRGLENLPTDSSCLAIANHASYMDGLVLTAALPHRFTFVVQDGAGRWPYVGLVLRRMGCSFVNRSSARDGAAQTRQLIRRVQQGESLAIFAEGTFDPEPGLLPFKKGAFLIAARAGAPVVPVGIRGTRRFFGGHRRLLHWSPLEVEVGPLIAPDPDAASLRDATRREVLLRCGEPDRHAMPAPNGDLL